MESSKYQEIAERAYALWEQEERPDGRSLDHWYKAEQELTSLDRKRPSAVVLAADAASHGGEGEPPSVVRSPRKPTLATRRGRRVSPDPR
jgi:hypothetical protein